MTWSQAAPYFGPTSGQQLPSTLDINTSPGVTDFDGQILTVWCGNNEYIQSSFQSSPSVAPTTIYTSTIPCSGAGGKGRITVTPFNGKVYAMGQALNLSGYNEFTIISSSDGINWTSSLANVTYNGIPDGTFALGFGLYQFQPNGTGPQYLYLAYASVDANSPGFSVARSSDGQNFAWQGTVASYSGYSEPEAWDQSPAIYGWLPSEGGTGDLYVAYLTSGAYTVMAHSADGVNWSSQEITTTLLNRDVVLVPHNDALYFGGQSYYSARNLWLAGSYDGVTWPAASNYGSVMRTSPSAVNFNGDFYDVIAGCCNANIWGNWAY